MTEDLNGKPILYEDIIVLPTKQLTSVGGQANRNSLKAKIEECADWNTLLLERMQGKITQPAKPKPGPTFPPPIQDGTQQKPNLGENRRKPSILMSSTTPRSGGPSLDGGISESKTTPRDAPSTPGGSTGQFFIKLMKDDKFKK
jgi:hypothetical protein